MPVITRLVAGKKNPNRVNIYLDDQFTLALSLDEVVKHGLKKGLEITSETIRSLQTLDEQDKIYAKILNFLSYRPHSEAEVRSRLRIYQALDPEVIILRLYESHHLDDLKFAQWFVDSRSIHKLRSPIALTAELARKGISREIIAQVISGTPDPSVTISHILTKKLGDHHPLSAPKRQKTYAYLSRQGFAWETIKEVVKDWESE